jgi:small subunit ribosomal protein S21
MVTVERRQNEDDRQLVRRFKSRVARSGILRAARQKRWFVSDSEKRRLALKKAERRENRRLRKWGKKG